MRAKSVILIFLGVLMVSSVMAQTSSDRIIELATNTNTINRSDFWDNLDTPDDISGSEFWYNHTLFAASAGDSNESENVHNNNQTQNILNLLAGTDVYSTFNDTYDDFAYNQTINTYYYNQTDTVFFYNMSIAVDGDFDYNFTTVAESLFILLSSEGDLNVNSSGFWDGLDSPSDISGSEFWYNHTSEFTDTDTNETAFRITLVGDNCPAGEVAVGVSVNGSLICDTDQTGSGGGNIFDQDLNTTSEVFFDQINVSVPGLSGDRMYGIAVVSRNSESSAMEITGNETSRGTVKISHDAPLSTGDSSSSALSIALRGDTTASQGIFMAIGNSTGDALTVSDGTYSHFVIESEGDTIITSDNSNALLVQELDGTDVFRVDGASNLAWVRKLIAIADGTYDIGDGTHRFDEIFFDGQITNNTVNLTWNNLRDAKLYAYNHTQLASGGGGLDPEYFDQSLNRTDSPTFNHLNITQLNVTANIRAPSNPLNLYSGGDLQIWPDGQVADGLQISSDGTNMDVSGFGVDNIQINDDLEVSGDLIAPTLAVSTNISLGDDDSIYFGASNDAQIYWDNAGGFLRIRVS